MSSVVSFGGPWNATSSLRGSTEGKFSPPYVFSFGTANFKNNQKSDRSPLEIFVKSSIENCYVLSGWCEVRNLCDTLCQYVIIHRFPEAAWHFTKTLTMCACFLQKHLLSYIFIIVFLPAFTIFRLTCHVIERFLCLTTSKKFASSTTFPSVIPFS